METREFLSINIRGVEDRTVEFIISDASKDRHGTILDPGSWKLDNFKKNGVFSYQHNIHEEINPDFVLGPATAYIEGDKLIGRATFEREDINPLAEKIFKKVKAGTLKSVSVGFLPGEEIEYGDDIILKNNELLEFSIVNIPSNPNAVKRSANNKNRKRNNNILNYY